MDAHHAEKQKENTVELETPAYLCKAVQKLREPRACFGKGLAKKRVKTQFTRGVTTLAELTKLNKS